MCVIALFRGVVGKRGSRTFKTTCCGGKNRSNLQVPFVGPLCGSLLSVGTFKTTCGGGKNTFNLQVPFVGPFCRFLSYVSFQDDLWW